LVSFEQTGLPPAAMTVAWDYDREEVMFTSAECRAHAEQKLEQAEHDQQHRRRLITAAEAWLNLASLLRRTEARLSGPKTTTRKE
jgi:hypothetical protein